MSKRIRRWCWLLVGGSKVEQMFKALSKSILGNRKKIGELKSLIERLEMRVWELEDHTPQETCKKVTNAVQLFGFFADKLPEKNDE